MAKIKLLLGAGVPYAATTPLWYTLALDNKYCHTGHRKEPQWLDIIQKQEEQKYISPEKYEKGYRFTDRSRRFPDTPSAYYRSRHKKGMEHTENRYIKFAGPLAQGVLDP